MGLVHLDALDGIQEMVNEADKKGVYENVMCCMLGASYKLPVEDSECFAYGSACLRVKHVFCGVVRYL